MVAARAAPPLSRKRAASANRSRAPSVPAVSPAAVAFIVTEPTKAIAWSRRRGGGRVAGAGDGAGARGLREGDDGAAVGGDGVACGVLDGRRQDAGGAGGQDGGGAGQRDGRGTVDDGERAEGAGGEPAGAGLPSRVTEPTSAPVIVLVAMLAGGGGGARAGDRAGAGPLAEGDDGRAVAVTVLPVVSRIVAVSTRVAPARSRLGDSARQAKIWAAVPWTTAKEPSVPVVRLAAVVSMTTPPDERRRSSSRRRRRRRRWRCRRRRQSPRRPSAGRSHSTWVLSEVMVSRLAPQRSRSK